MKLFNPYRLFAGSFIPNCLMEYSEISSTAKLVWARLSQYAGEKGYCWPKQETLAKEVGLSTDRVKRVLAELKDAGFIEIKHPKGVDKLNHAPNKYYFVYHPIFHPQEPSFEGVEEGSQEDVGGCTFESVENDTSESVRNNTSESVENNTSYYIKEVSHLEKNHYQSGDTLPIKPSRRTRSPGTSNNKSSISVQDTSLPTCFIEDLDFMNKWSEFKQFRKQIQHPIRTKNIGSTLVRLSKGQIDTAIAIIQQSLDNEWRGLFAITERTRPNVSNTNRPQSNSSDSSKYNNVRIHEIGSD